MLQLLYVSSAVTLPAEADLDQILQEARAWNTPRDITGILLYAEGTYFQVLEGDDAEVEKLFKMINGDPRHQGVIVLLRRQITERDFPGWSMGFHRADRLADLPPAFFKLSRSSVQDVIPENTSSEIVTLLRSYTENTVRQVL